MSSASSFNGFGLGVLLAAIAAGSAPSALAEIRATGKNGLRTEVNGLRRGGIYEFRLIASNELGSSLPGASSGPLASCPGTPSRAEASGPGERLPSWRADAAASSLVPSSLPNKRRDVIDELQQEIEQEDTVAAQGGKKIAPSLWCTAPQGVPHAAQRRRSKCLDELSVCRRQQGRVVRRGVPRE